MLSPMEVPPHAVTTYSEDEQQLQEREEELDALHATVGQHARSPKQS